MSLYCFCKKCRFGLNHPKVRNGWKMPNRPIGTSPSIKLLILDFVLTNFKRFGALLNTC
jgi:hypothetical protein